MTTINTDDEWFDSARIFRSELLIKLEFNSNLLKSAGFVVEMWTSCCARQHKMNWKLLYFTCQVSFQSDQPLTGKTLSFSSVYLVGCDSFLFILKCSALLIHQYPVVVAEWIFCSSFMSVLLPTKAVANCTMIMRSNVYGPLY